MNKTQEKAINWLITQGYKKSDLIVRQKSPSIVTKDNKKYEIKRLYGTQIIFYNTHYHQLKKFPSTTILVFRDNEEIPFLKFKFEEIKTRPLHYKEIEINWVNKDIKISTVRLSESTKERLQSYGKMGEDFNQLINRILNEVDKK